MINIKDKKGYRSKRKTNFQILRKGANGKRRGEKIMEREVQRIEMEWERRKINRKKGREMHDRIKEEK